MLIDVHLHTNRYSPCSKTSPEDMMAQAVKRGLDGVVITEHNIVWKDDEIRALREQFPALRIFRGVEVVTEEREEVLIYGIPDAEDLAGKLPAATLVEKIRERGGASILAHPLRYRETIAESLYQSPPDACEGWSLNIYAFQRPGIQAFSAATGCGITAATDAHATFGLGCYAIRLDEPATNDAELVEALRNQHYTPHRDERMLEDLEQDLPDRVARVEAMLAAKADRREIHDAVRCSFSFIRHVEEGRYPSWLRDAEDATTCQLSS